LGRRLVGDPLHDGRPFRDAGAVVELQHRHVAQRIDPPEVAAAFERLGARVGLDLLEGQACLVEDDVGGERAGAGGIVELHRASPWAFWGKNAYAFAYNADAYFTPHAGASNSC